MVFIFWSIIYSVVGMCGEFSSMAVVDFPFLGDSIMLVVHKCSFSEKFGQFDSNRLVEEK